MITAETMKTVQHPKALTPAVMSAILSQQNWTPCGKKIRVQALHSTTALLEKAGIQHPKPFDYYEVPVRRDDQGFLVLDTLQKRPPLSTSDDELSAIGGIFYGHPPADEPANESQRCEILCEITLGRRFEIPVAPGRKIRITALAFEDAAFPTPNELPKWEPSAATDTELIAAFIALVRARAITDFEK